MTKTGIHVMQDTQFSSVGEEDSVVHSGRTVDVAN